MKKLIPALTIAVLIFIMAFSPKTKRKFTIVLIPDTQHYTYKFEDRFDTYKKQMKWIADNQENENIKFVIHLGDITQHNSDEEWKVAKEAQTVLYKAKMPHSMLPGNHDYPGGGSFDSRNTEKYNLHFGPQWFEIADYRSWYGGHKGTTNDNNYCFFESEGLKFMVISLEYAPRKETLCWASEVIRKNKDRRVIIATHCYLGSGGERCNCGIGYTAIGNSHADFTWKEFIRKHSNIFMVVAGHVNDSEHHVATGLNGNRVHEILTDYQAELMDNERYGNGWMRTLTFDPDNNRVEVKTFTVLNSVTELNLLDSETGNRYSSDPNDPDHKFSFSYNMSNPLAKNVELNNISSFSDMTVNITGSGQQKRPSVAVAKNGDYLVVWEDDQDNNGKYQIYARGFYSGGCEKFPAKTVNIDPGGQQLKPKAGIADDGSFVVVWEDDKDENGYYEIRGARFTAMGVKKSHDFTVNIDGNRQQLKPDIAVAPNGDYVVVWEDDSKGEAGIYQVYARGYKSDGTQKFSPITVNNNSNGQQLKPSVAISSSGSFAVTWEDDSDRNGKYQVLCARFNAAGVKSGNDFIVNTNADGQQRNPDIAMNVTGNFVIVWEDDSNENGLYQVKAARFSPSGIKQGSDFTVNSNSNGQQITPSIAISTGGDFVVVWEDDSDSNNSFQILGRGFYANGTEKFSAKTINSLADGQQKKPDIGLNANGDFITVWEDDADGNSYYEIAARGFRGNGNQ
ncbi:MAG: metallophosphoesterase [Ferruginibacter sp.]